MTIITAAHIKTLLRKRYPKGEWALAFEVGNATGSNVRRHADAIAMNLWPSRGLAIHGFEVKVSKQDWKKELLTPEKAEAVAKYCDHWWIVAPEGIVQIEDVPAAWGLLIASKDKITIAKHAPEKPALPVTRDFMAAIFRRISDADRDEIEAAARTRAAEIDRDREKSFEQRVESRLKKFQRMADRVKEFESAAGISLDDWNVQPKEFGEAVRFVLQCKIFGSYRSVKELRDSMAETVAEMNKVLESQGAANG